MWKKRSNNPLKITKVAASLSQKYYNVYLRSFSSTIQPMISIHLLLHFHVQWCYGFTNNQPPHALHQLLFSLAKSRACSHVIPYLPNVSLQVLSRFFQVLLKLQRRWQSWLIIIFLCWPISLQYYWLCIEQPTRLGLSVVEWIIGNFLYNRR